jgi:hypothetical protein
MDDRCGPDDSSRLDPGRTRPGVGVHPQTIGRIENSNRKPRPGFVSASTASSQPGPSEANLMVMWLSRVLDRRLAAAGHGRVGRSGGDYARSSEADAGATILASGVRPILVPRETIPRAHA